MTPEQLIHEAARNRSALYLTVREVETLSDTLLDLENNDFRGEDDLPAAVAAILLRQSGS